MNEKYELSSYLKAMRILRSLTVADLANLVGVSKSTIRRWECQESIPDVKSGYLLAVALNCEIYDIFTLDRRHGKNG